MTINIETINVLYDIIVTILPISVEVYLIFGFSENHQVFRGLHG